MQQIDKQRTLQTLFLPDGRLAASLRLTPLLAELNRLGIPGIVPNMVKSALLDLYAAHVNAVAEKINLPPMDQRTPEQIKKPEAFKMKEAAKSLDGRHAV